MAQEGQLTFGNRDDQGLPDPLARAVQITVGGGRPALSARRAASMIRNFLGCYAVEIWVKRTEYISVLLEETEMCCPFLQGGTFWYTATYEEPLR